MADHHSTIERALLRAGMNPNALVALAAQPEVAKRLAAWLASELTPSPLPLTPFLPLIPELRISLVEQLNNTRDWNDLYEWDFGPRAFDAVDTTPADAQGALIVDTIVPILPPKGGAGGVQCTFEALSAVAVSRQPRAWRWPELKSDHIRLLPDIEHTPGIYRVTLNLGAHWDPISGTAPVTVRGPTSAHAHVLAAASQFPGWVQAMGREDVPAVFLPGYQARVLSENWDSVPALEWYGPQGLIRLHAYLETYAARFLASPEVLKVW